MTMHPTVLIYNPISGHGHLDSWNALFVALLLDRGWRVVALTPNSDALVSRLEHKGLSTSENFQLLNWNANRSLLQSLWERWNCLGDKYFYRRPGSEVTPNLSVREYSRRVICQASVPFLFRLSYYFYTRYLRFRRRGWQLGMDQADNKDCPVVMSRRVRKALKKAKWPPALAFNMYMDTYVESQSKWDEFAAMNTLRWAGIRFVPPATPSDPWYRVPLWRGMCLLDESVLRTYSEALPEKCFEYLPDITETALPEHTNAVTNEIRRRAGGRKIVFLGGSIGGQKNLARWFDLIDLADPQEWFFVQLGEIHRNTLTTDDVAALDKALAAPRENLLLYAEYLPDEKTFNQAISACDVIFAVYRNFRISSNMLGKAAHFKKPILVSDRYLLGERVAEYRIGYTVDEEDARSILLGLVAAISDPLPEDGFSRYCTDFSTDELALRLENLLNKCSK